jgi:hypothetical protein
MGPGGIPELMRYNKHGGDDFENNVNDVDDNQRFLALPV